MNVSQFEIVEKSVRRLKQLKEARDAAEFGAISITAEERSYGDNPDEFDIKELTSVVECRHAIKDMLDRHISECRQHLKVYGVDDDE